MTPSITPNIVLIKKSYTDPKSMFHEEVYPNLKQTKVSGCTLFFYDRPQKRVPDWAGFVSGNFSLSGAPFENASSYAVILLNVQGRIFLAPFGMGIHLIDMEVVERDFGLRVALNAALGPRLLKIQTRTISSNPLNTSKQSLRDRSVDEYGINKNVDVLNGVISKLQDSYDLGKIVEGKDTLKANIKISNLNELGKFCQRALSTANSSQYKTHFSWVDNIKEEQNLAVLDKLNVRLIKKLQSSAADELLIYTDYDDLSGIEGFIFTGNKQRIEGKPSFLEPAISDFISEWGKQELATLTIDDLKRTCKLLTRTDGGEHLKPKSLFRVLFWETKLGGKNYVLSDGSWYAIDNDFYVSVEKFFKSNLISGFSLPKFSDSKDLKKIKGKNVKSEGAYNARIASNSKNICVFDIGVNGKRGIGSGKDSEFCDLFYYQEKRLVHVKRGDAPASLSHLFRQGVTSTEIMVNDQGAVTRVRKFLQDDNFKKIDDVMPKTYDPENFEVIFAVILDIKKQKKDIGFFSKLSFMHAVQDHPQFSKHSVKFMFVESEP